jgi:hypothetical protein
VHLEQLAVAVTLDDDQPPNLTIPQPLLLLLGLSPPLLVGLAPTRLPSALTRSCPRFVDGHQAGADLQRKCLTLLRGSLKRPPEAMVLHLFEPLGAAERGVTERVFRLQLCHLVSLLPLFWVAIGRTPAFPQFFKRNDPMASQLYATRFVSRQMIAATSTSHASAVIVIDLVESDKVGAARAPRQTASCREPVADVLFF